MRYTIINYKHRNEGGKLTTKFSILLTQKNQKPLKIEVHKQSIMKNLESTKSHSDIDPTISLVIFVIVLLKLF